MSITVAEEGNRRIGEMNTDEVVQCIGGKLWNFNSHVIQFYNVDL
jgi:hypothetical protein